MRVQKYIFLLKWSTKKVLKIALQALQGFVLQKTNHLPKHNLYGPVESVVVV